MDIAALLSQLAPQLNKIKADLLAFASQASFVERLGLLYDAILQLMALANTIAGAAGPDKKAFVMAAAHVLYEKLAPSIPGYSVWSWFVSNAMVEAAIDHAIERIYAAVFAQAVKA